MSNSKINVSRNAFLKPTNMNLEVQTQQKGGMERAQEPSVSYLLQRPPHISQREGLDCHPIVPSPTMRSGGGCCWVVIVGKVRSNDLHNGHIIKVYTEIKKCKRILKPLLERTFADILHFQLVWIFANFKVVIYKVTKFKKAFTGFM